MRARINERNGAAVILFAGFVFSFGALVFRGKSDATDEWQFLFYRGLSLFVVVSVVFWSDHRARAWPVLRRGLAKSALAGALLMGMFTAFIVALSRIDAATTLFLQSLAPFSAALMGWLWLRERVDVHTWAAMGCAVVGVVIMGSSWDTGDTTGILVACIIPVLFGGYSVLLRDSVDRDPLAPIIVAALLGAGVGAAVTASQGGIGVPLGDAVLGCVSGGVLLGLGIPLMNTAGQYVPAARIALLLLLEVVLTPVWVWLFVDERPTDATLVGGVVILAALTWLARHPSTTAPAQSRT